MEREVESVPNESDNMHEEMVCLRICTEEQVRGCKTGEVTRLRSLLSHTKELNIMLKKMGQPLKYSKQRSA